MMEAPTNIFDALDALIDQTRAEDYVSLSFEEIEHVLDRVIEKASKSVVLREYIRHLKSAGKNTLPWHAEGERQYASVEMVSCGKPDGPTVFVGAEPTADPLEIQRVAGAGILVRAAQVYLWTYEMEELADATPLPRHVISRDIMPYPMMFWSRDIARISDEPGSPQNNWLFLQYHKEGIMLYTDRQQGTRNLAICAAGIPFGKTYPDDFPGQERQVGAILARLAFLNSPYIETETGRLPRAWRREMHRKGTPKEHCDPQIRIVKLRRDAQEQIDAHREAGERREWQGHWWVSGHYRAQWYPSLKAHKVVWIAPYLKGDRDKPLISKVYHIVR